jgi:hypothetical protein
MKKVHWSVSLRRINACDEAIEWCSTQPSRQAAWDACTNPDWILFALDKSGSLGPSECRLLACAFARTALPYAGMTREVCERTITVAERHARGEATDEELSAARSEAQSAARSAAWSAAWSADESAAESAARSAARSSARSSAWSAAQSAARSSARSVDELEAWSAAWSVARSAARSAAWSAARRAQCDVIRGLYPRHRLPALRGSKK